MPPTSATPSSASRRPARRPWQPRTRRARRLPAASVLRDRGRGRARSTAGLLHVSAAARVPADTESTRGTHFKALLGGGTAVVGGAVAAAIAFAIGAASHNAAVMIGGPVAVALFVIAA